MSQRAFHPASYQEGPLIALVVAVARNGVIGAEGDLAWRISDDLKWFKQVTMGKSMIMGRKTWDSIGVALPGRRSIVVSRQVGLTAEGADVATDLDDAIALASRSAVEARHDEICIIGGAAIYEQILPKAERIYLTAVGAEVAGDVFFPALDFGAWRSIRVAEAEKSARNEHSCEFFILHRQIRHTKAP